jgi:hypothetical protein
MARKLSGLDLAIWQAEQARRRDRTQNGRSPAQHTTLSVDQARAFKRPGKRNRAAAQRRAVAEAMA